MVQQAGKALQFDGFDQLLKVDEPSVPSLEYSYGFEGFRTWRKGPGKEEFWFSAGDVMRGGTREHVITVGDRLVARVKAGVVGGGAMGPVKWNWDSREERKVGRMPLPEFAILVLMAGLCAALAVMSAVQARRRRHWAPAGAAGMVAVLLGAMVAGGCGNALTRTGQAWTTPDVTYVHHGVAAGPVLFTRPDGSVLDERRYEPFGGDLDSFHETADTARTGSGVAGINFSIDPQNLLNKETDKATGWSYHGARWMASSFAMWLSPDPPVKAPDGKFMGEPWGLNPYQYVEQNPSAYWDPDGRALNLVAAGVGAVVGAAGGAAVQVASNLLASPSRPVGQGVAGATIGGAVAGGMIGLTMGGSLLVTAAAGGLASVTGGGVQRAVNTGSPQVSAANMSFDFAAGATMSVAPPLMSRGIASIRSSLSYSMPAVEAVSKPGVLISGPVRNANGGVDFAGTPHLYPAGEGQSNTVKIEYTGSRRQDFGAANQASGVGTTQKPPDDYSWHHVNDYDPATNTGTMQLVETAAHEATYPHNGGVKQYQDATGRKYK